MRVGGFYHDFACLLACLTAMELEQTTDPTHLKLLLLKEVHWIVHNISSTRLEVEGSI